ncbi:hypothetical protein [Algibacillus agarilyticus]|uniref:hypothetical protein n=1 Tax=Algibacillus agarilyticus TaxID=2234133 RepID=UPI000DD01541|nr:hypothetical protein [Algibacillus agarilyticus]
MHEHNTPVDSLDTDPNQENYKLCLKLGNGLGITALCITLICIFINFGFEQYFALGAQIAAHIGTIIFAALAKLGYVIRCVGAYGLGHRAF